VGFFMLCLAANSWICKQTNNTAYIFKKNK
jgi:hypothetical protein